MPQCLYGGEASIYIQFIYRSNEYKILLQWNCIALMTEEHLIDSRSTIKRQSTLTGKALFSYVDYDDHSIVLISDFEQ